MATGAGGKAPDVVAGNGGDLYAVLGLKKECTHAELKVAYKKMAMTWHPDRCSPSGGTKHAEEANERFQEIQGAYSVLSDSNKRFLYDVGIYDNGDERDDDISGMGEFLGEMAQMMSQAPPTETFEELQQLFVDMFQADLDEQCCSGPPMGDLARARNPVHSISLSPSPSLSPTPPATTKAEAPSCTGINKQCSSAKGSGKPPRPSDAGLA